MTETVLVFGASGNIGVAAIIGALNAKRHVIAVVRNQASAEKILKYVECRDGITIVEADITSEDSVRGVVDKVRNGSLPSFQHVWASLAYRATVPYLLEKGFPGSTWTMCTGGQGDMGYRVAPAVTQGALFSFAIAAARENEKTNIRFNEVYLVYRVQFEVDKGSQTFAGLEMTTSKSFAPLYEKLLHRTDIRSSRVKVLSPQDVVELSYMKNYKD
ncbi:hypothetical protein ColTof4_01690 [Colletotrichum tofieldiae]|nr:hypothetical protein ColTof3_10029 [Colletotrichum tofieldiae]GKT69267.1 hypothetical protein ColTof4_01690 [Colletotrichum tofieldiae]GKT96438.1 hypothetical protein Ct61P_14288 [Colletotrichum tofieldiae]